MRETRYFDARGREVEGGSGGSKGRIEDVTEEGEGEGERGDGSDEVMK